MTKPETEKVKPLDCRLKYWYDLNVGDIVYRAGQRCRISKRTLDAVWLEAADEWREDDERETGEPG